MVGAGMVDYGFLRSTYLPVPTIKIALGCAPTAERNGEREIAIRKRGATL